MAEEEIIHKALESIGAKLLAKGKWKKTGPKELDGQLSLTINNNNLNFNIEIKTEVKEQMLPKIIELHKKYDPFLLVAARIYPKTRKLLYEYNIPYLEVNGNFFLKRDNLLFFIDNNPPIHITPKGKNRAFSKTGVRVVYELLQDKCLINQPYRLIADKTKTSIGNITNIINGLNQLGFLIPSNKKEKLLINKNNLLEKWADAYTSKLKPQLKVGTFDFAHPDNYLNWEKINLKEGKTCWGGEPAADLLTHFLQPEEFILYTTETYSEVMRNYKLIPHDKGKIKIYKKFWSTGEIIKHAAPPLITYADLIDTGNSRCIETAKKIYEKYLRKLLE